MKKLFKLGFVLLLSLALVACGSGTEGSTEEGKVKVAFLFTARGDKSTSDAVWVGAERAKNELGVETVFIELPNDTSKYRAAVLEASESDVDLIIGNAGSGMIDELYRAAEEFPEKYYMVLDAPADMEIEFDNFIGESFKQNEVSYLAGFLAGLQTETGTIGAIVGVEYPVLQDFITGYISGAVDANPNVKVATSVVGDFMDAAKAKEIANVQYNLGADIVFNVAGPAGYGILEAGKEQGKTVIGVDIDQALGFIGVDDEQANAIITSAKKGWGEATFSVIERFVKGPETLPWATVERMGIAEDGVGLAENDIYKAQVSQEVQDQVTELIAKIKAGEVKTPSFFEITTEEYNDLKNSVKP